MDSYPAPALALVEAMRAAAAADPARAVAFQGAPGANSHRAALEWAPDCLPLPCFAFEDALDAVKTGSAGSAIIPIENSQHGRVAARQQGRQRRALFGTRFDHARDREAHRMRPMRLAGLEIEVADDAEAEGHDTGEKRPAGDGVEAVGHAE